MTLKFAAPDSYDYHERIYDRIAHGNLQRVGNLVHKHRSQLSREYNPDEPQNCAAYEAGLELAAWKEVQPEIFELQADALTDLIVVLRTSDAGGVEGADRLALKKACDDLTTAMQSRDEAQERSAMVKLSALLDSRLRREMSQAERCRLVRSCAG